MNWPRWIAWGWMLAAAHAASAAASPDEVYLVSEDTESIHLSNRSPTPAAQRSTERLPTEHSRASASLERRAGLSRLVDQAATAHRIDPALLRAVIAVESDFAAHAVSPKGAQGLMQLMPATARDYGVTDAFDPRQNLDAGARHLRRLLDRFGQNPALALAAYNAGAEAVVRHQHQIPPYAETMAYVPRVLQRLAELQRETR